MRLTIHKMFWSWDFEKEEKWLNDMSAKGLQLVGIGLCKYIFEEGTPGGFIYRLELLEHYPTHPESVSYIHFLEETGVEHVGSFMRWVYFRRKSNDGEFDLYSDIESRIKHLKRIITFILCVLPIQISALMANTPFALEGSTNNLVCVCLIALIIVLISIGISKLCIKIRKLKKERIIRE